MLRIFVLSIFFNSSYSYGDIGCGQGFENFPGKTIIPFLDRGGHLKFKRIVEFPEAFSHYPINKYLKIEWMKNRLPSTITPMDSFKIIKSETIYWDDQD